MMKYSIVAPAYNEQQSLRLFYDELTLVLRGIGEEYEILFINDGSTDDTATILDALAAEDKRVKVCHFSRNFGQQAAIYCGLQRACGEAVVVMDTDLQDPPTLLPALMDKWKEGYQIVHGKRKKRKGEHAFKKGTARLFYKVARKITGLDIPMESGDFKLYDRAAVDAILGLPERDRLLRVQACWVGFRHAFVEFDRPERAAGTSHYTAKKMMKLAQAGVLPNTDFPLRLPFKLGAFLSVASIACYLAFILLGVCGIPFGGLTAWLFPTIGLCTGVSLTTQGMANLYTAMIYKEVQNRPQYVIANERNFEQTKEK